MRIDNVLYTGFSSQHAKRAKARKPEAFAEVILALTYDFGANKKTRTTTKYGWRKVLLTSAYPSKRNTRLWIGSIHHAKSHVAITICQLKALAIFAFHHKNASYIYGNTCRRPLHPTGTQFPKYERVGKPDPASALKEVI